MAKRNFTFKPDEPLPDDHDPQFGCCEAYSHSGRCHYPASTSNGGDKFLCFDHFHRKGDFDDVVRRSHIDIPHPDYSREARARKSLSDFMKEMADYLYRNGAKAKASDVIRKLT